MPERSILALFYQDQIISGLAKANDLYL